jgi:hypothetical protein
MKVTVEISDALLEKARELAAERSTTLRQIFEDGLIRVIDSSTEPKPAYKMRDLSFGDNGHGPKITWEEMRDLSYQRRGA